MTEKRLDVLVCEAMDVPREYAKEVITAGKCAVAGKIVTKPGAKFAVGVDISIDAEKMPYVSRGGLKLAKALEIFDICLEGRQCLDIGASTGGFTHCMLANGAKCVIALDNGTGQLSSQLARDCRVISIEGTDIRAVGIEDLPFTPDFIACDVSFISLEKIIPTIASLLAPGKQAVLLLKPQFECGRGELNKKGVVKNPAARDAAINRVSRCLAAHGLIPRGVIQSPITGQNGNIEYLIHAESRGDA